MRGLSSQVAVTVPGYRLGRNHPIHADAIKRVAVLLALVIGTR